MTKTPLLLDTPPDQWQFEGTQSFRARQVREWIYEHGVLDFSGMTNLPAGLREKLADQGQIRPMEITRVQGPGDTTR